MGKTSLLNNFGRLLPGDMVPLFSDLQGPASAASDVAGFLHAICRQMRDSAQRLRDLSIPEVDRIGLSRNPIDQFDQWLSAVESALPGRTVLLAMDEFEALDLAFRNRRLAPADVLGLLPHVVQHRRAFRILLAASHTLDELRDWSSYLINLLPIRIGHLSDAEAQQLIERPMRDFPLIYHPPASNRIREWTSGHPYLTQLLCHCLVTAKNAQPIARRLFVTVGDVEAAVPDALVAGTFFFQDLETEAGIEAVSFLRASAASSALDSHQLARGGPALEAPEAERLLRREILTTRSDGRLAFVLPLVARWFSAEVRPESIST